MLDTCTLELYAAGAWHAAASVSLLGSEADGWKAKTYSGYAVEWAFAHAGATDAHALYARRPVGLEPYQEEHWPVHLIDMLPQGYGRQELLRRIGAPAAAGVVADWRLLLEGAGNPIGNLRVKEAADWLAANDGSDYTVEDANGNAITVTGGSFTLSIPAGQSTVNFSVDPVGDTVFEGAETVIATITSAATTNSAGGSVSLVNLTGKGAATGSIVDDGSDPDGTGPQTPDDDRPDAVDDALTLQFEGELAAHVILSNDGPAPRTQLSIIGIRYVDALGRSAQSAFADLAPSGRAGYTKQVTLADGTLHLNADGQTLYQHAGRRFEVTAVSPDGVLEHDPGNGAWQVVALGESIIVTLAEIESGRLRYTPEGGGAAVNQPVATVARVVELDWRTDGFEYTIADSGGLAPDTATVRYTVQGGDEDIFQDPIDLGDDADIDGITATVESVLANRARGLDGIRAETYTLDLRNLIGTGAQGQSEAQIGTAYDGDLNLDLPDSIGDALQNAVTTFAWINNGYFEAANADPFASDVKAIVTLVAEDSASSRSVPDPLVQLRDVRVAALTATQLAALQPLVQFTPGWSPMGFSAEVRADAPPGTVIDHDPTRTGQQWRFTVDISRTGETLDTFMAFYKWVDQATVDAYELAGVPLTDLSGAAITREGWVDFTRVEPGGDGVQIARTPDGGVLFLDYVITDNAFGDADLTPGRITDPGIPVFFTRTIEVSGQSDVAEGSNAVFRVTLNVPKSAPTAVRLSLADGPGASGTDSPGGTPADYSPASMQAYYFDALGARQSLAIAADGTVVLPARVTSFFVSVPTVDDFELEGPETFALTATLPEGTSAQAVATLLDDGSGKVYRPDGTADPSAVPSDDRPRPRPELPASPPPPAPPAPPPAPTEAPPPPASSPFNSALQIDPGSPAQPTSRLLPIPDSGRGPGMGEALTSSAGFRAVVMEAEQPALLAFRGITDQFVEGNRTTTFNLPADAFVHTRPEAVLTLGARLTDGQDLPAWIRFDAQAGTFTVTPPPGFAAVLEVRITARDNEGREAAALFKFNVGQGASVLEPASAPAPAGDTPRPQSRSGLSEQIRQAQGRGGMQASWWRAPGVSDQGLAGGAERGIDRSPGIAVAGRPAGLLERILASRAVQDRVLDAARAAEARAPVEGQAPAAPRGDAGASSREASAPRAAVPPQPSGG